jgi:hypothetical protein
MDYAAAIALRDPVRGEFQKNKPGLLSHPDGFFVCRRVKASFTRRHTKKP